MRTRHPLLLAACLGLILAGCESKKSDRSPTIPNPSLPPRPGTNSVRVRTGQEASLRISGGVEIHVFKGSVPTMPSGAPGELVFSIEPAETPQGPPAGYTMPGEAWQYGPEGITFSERCRIAMAVTDPGMAYMLGRYNSSTSSWELVPTQRNASGDRVYADVKHLSTWALFEPVGGSNPGAMGCAHFDNLDATRTTSLCLKSFTLAEPDRHPDFDAAAVGAILAESGHHVGISGVGNQANLILPQGTYSFEATRSRALSQVTGWNPDGWIELPPVVVAEPWQPGTRANVVSISPSGWSEVNRSPSQGPCEGPIDFAYGTGLIQITLTWSDQVDLDLHVIEPSGEEIYFGHPRSQSGGTLDRDTICLDGAENIFWGESAPHGTFTVKVHLFSACNHAGVPVPFAVRRLVDGNVETFSGEAGYNETVTITTFTR